MAAWRGAREASQPQDRKGESGRRKNKGACEGDKGTATGEGLLRGWGGKGLTGPLFPVLRWFLVGRHWWEETALSCRREMLWGQGAPPPRRSPGAWGSGGSYL